MELQISLVSSNANHYINAVATVLNTNISIMRFAASSSATSVNTGQCRTCDTPAIFLLLLYALEKQL